jgi:delta-1-pyrroline-5-carboxylate synthetase
MCPNYVMLCACVLQIAALALRSGNGLLLKGGKEAARSNAILHKVIVDAVGELGPDLIHLVTSRDEIAGEHQPQL